MKTPKHKEDLAKRKDKDIDFLIFAVASLTSIGLVGLCMSSWF